MEVSVFNFNFFLFCSFFKLQNIFLLFSTLQMFTFTTLFPPWSTLWKLVLRRLQDVFIKKNVCWFRFVTYRYPHFYVSKTSRRCLQDICLQDVFKTCLQDVFKTYVTIFRLPRHFQDVLRNVFKTPSRRLCNTFSIRLGRRKIVTPKTCWWCLQDISWRCFQDVFKTNKCLLGLNSPWKKKMINNYLNVPSNSFTRVTNESHQFWL